LNDKLELKLQESAKHNQDLSHEVLTLQRINESLKDDIQRLKSKHEHTLQSLSTLQQDLDTSRKTLLQAQLSEKQALFDRDEAREQAAAALKERDAMLERFNEYGLEMQRRQDEVIERVKREMAKKVKEIIERAERAEEREGLAR
jgi:DNA-binding GntR family transcriptional regulator